jgi:hypothetical protein
MYLGALGIITMYFDSNMKSVYLHVTNFIKSLSPSPGELIRSKDIRLDAQKSRPRFRPTCGVAKMDVNGLIF